MHDRINKKAAQVHGTPREAKAA